VGVTRPIIDLITGDSYSRGSYTLLQDIIWTTACACDDAWGFNLRLATILGLVSRCLLHCDCLQCNACVQYVLIRPSLMGSQQGHIVFAGDWQPEKLFCVYCTIALMYICNSVLLKYPKHTNLRVEFHVGIWNLKVACYAELICQLNIYCLYSSNNAEVGSLRVRLKSTCVCFLEEDVMCTEM